MTTVAAIAFAATVSAAGLPEGEFRNPSVANRPETYVFFIGGNVAKPGITADFEAIKDAGLSGILLFHGQFGSPWPGVSPQIKCLSESWDGLMGFVADECRRLGLSFSMHNCPGWAMSGGPWIKPENAMRNLIWTRIDVEGGKRVEVKLPTLAPSAPDPRDYRDIAVLAFPATAGEWVGALKPAKVTSNVKADWEAWRTKGTPVRIGGGVTATITFDFAEPVTIRTVELPGVNSLGHGFCYEPEMTVVCEANGKTLFTREMPQANWQDDRPVTFSCDETTTKQLTVTLKPRHAIKLRRINLFSSARNDDWEAQAGWTLRSLMRNPPAKQNEAAWVKSAEVRNVTKFMKPDGTFAWDAPAGKWAIVRVGHVNTMRRNGPAPKEGTGFECDKLSPAAADIQFDNYIGRLTGAVHGKLANVHLDSWECKSQTWTPGLDKMFRERFGYDLFTWMPAVFGYVVDSPEATARFLNDWRGFIGDLITENFYAQMAKRCHENGMTISFETSFGDVLPGDIMRFYKYADTPMCEYWQPRERSFVGSHNFKPVYPCVSAAHLYGKKRVAAEALTSFQLTWDEKLRDLKYVANLHMARGVSHMVFHTYTHNPRTDWLPPGTSFGAHIGTPFLRGQTWWKFMPDFTAYFARCQTMLEAGKPANDILWYLGDEWDHKPHEEAPFPAGYKFDYCNPDALLTRISVNDKGEWTTPDGTAYRLLWVPESKRMMPETMEKILDGVKKGAKVAFAALPESISTMRGGAAMQARFDEALAAMKASTGLTTVFASKNMYVGRSLEAVLANEKIAKDLVAEGVVWNHRRSDDADWYFISPARQNEGFTGTVGFRCDGDVEIWNPETGLSEKGQVASVKDGHTWVSLALAPHESRFVVFKRGVKLNPCAVVSTTNDVMTLAGPWKVSFPEGWGMPGEMTVDALKPWKELGTTPEAKAFSGTADYTIDFTLDKVDADAVVLLDLGRVESLAKVEVNGTKVGNVWSQPYRIPLTGAVKAGKNSLKVSVTDTWYNRLVFDAGQPEAKRRTWTIAGPKKGSALRDSGLIGPVRVIRTSRGRARSAELVDSRLGTARAFGSNVLGPCVPYGSAHPSPDSLWPTPHQRAKGSHHGFGAPTSGWWPGDKVVGFSQLHAQGTGGTPSYGIFRYVCDPQDMEILEAHPYLLKVRLKPSGLLVDVSATPHGAVYRVRGEDGVPRALPLDRRCKLAKADCVNAAGEFTGNWNPVPYRCFAHSEVDDATGIHRIAVSFKSDEQAKAYFAAELAGRTPDDVAKDSKHLWDETLSCISIEGVDDAERAHFYSILAQTFIQPRDRTADGIGWDDHYTLWDTWRTYFPLKAIIDPQTFAGNVNSFADRFARTGRCDACYTSGREYKVGQGGDEADCVIAEAWAKKIPGIDWARVVPLLRSRWTGRTKGYRERGYVPSGEREDYCGRMKSGSATMNFAYQDWCCAQVLRGLGDAEMAEKFLARSGNWTNVWDDTAFDAPSGVRGFARARGKDGRFAKTHPRRGFNTDFYEANCWEYSFFVPHDMDGLIRRCGGRDAFERRVAYALENNLVAFDNEPSFLIPWLFAYTGRGDLATKWAPRVATLFKGLDLPGDNDSGAMCALYVFIQLGFFPVAGQDLYLMHGSTYPKIVIRPLGGGKTFTIRSVNYAKGRRVKSVTLNGKPHDPLFLRHAEIAAGGELVFTYE